MFTLWADLQAATQRKPTVVRFARTWIVDAGFRAVTLYRVANLLHRYRVRFLPNAIAAQSVWSTGADIRPPAEIGPGFVIKHSVGVVIGAGARIGANCTILQNVTIGEKLGRTNDHTYPTIGDGVVVGVGAAILGPVTIGSGAVVGANSVVIRDVRAGATVVGAPARELRDGPAQRRSV